MFSIVMACLLIVLTAAVPLAIESDPSPFDIYPKASISNIKRDNPSKYLNEQFEKLSSEPYLSGGKKNVKRSTMLLNKLMHALHKALDNENEDIISEGVKDTPDVVPLIVDNYPMDLHRRGEDRMTRYWRCYFNAVSCF